MRFTFAAVLVLAIGCHKAPQAGGATGSAPVASGAGVTAGSGSAAAAEPAGGSATGPTSADDSAAASGSAATAGAPSPKLLALVDDFDRWLAPAWKIDVHPRFVALVGMQPTLRAKWESLKALAPPPGVDASAWSQAVDNLGDQIGGLGMCAKDFKPAWYAKASEVMKEAADEGYADCMKGIPDAFAAVVKLVPGAKPPGTHANDPLMSGPK